jgi:hypothetical protein
MLDKQCWHLITDPTSLYVEGFEGTLLPGLSLLVRGQAKIFLVHVAINSIWSQAMPSRDHMYRKGERVTITEYNWFPGFLAYIFKPLSPKNLVNW